MIIRLLFRVLLGLTLAVIFYARFTGVLPDALVTPFHYWLVASVFVFGAFGVWAAWNAWRDPEHRRVYFTDLMLALIWLPYWYIVLRQAR